ncbi:HAMP domain-containing histidine kinase [Candidatus Saccharibacteria bacterium]|nr:HAMP domain-containing histidine kinase [Candidatus Saccharibacteria bacterium]
MTVEETSLAIVAHDLKSPLATMRQLALGLDPASPSSVTQSQQDLITVSEQALRQVNDLVKIARLEDGLFELEPVSVPVVCDDVARELRFLYRENHKSLHPSYQTRATLAIANRELLHSIIYNFCTNALHYSDSNTSATLTVRQHQRHIRINIRDKGPALPTKIWKELQKGWLDRPTSIAMRPGSSGLGLYISTKFARHMGAKVGAIRHRDGTSFYIDLPISTQLSLF